MTQGLAPAIFPTVDDRRAEAGLPPMAEYYAELEPICAQEMPQAG